MIILIDNKNYMIRLCKDSPVIHGFDVTYPNWKGLAKFYSDIGETALLSGPEAESFLDENNIYYIHVEAKKKENFENFKRRMNRMIEENKEFIESSLSEIKLLFGVNKLGKVTNDVREDFAFCIVQDVKDGRVYIQYDIDTESLREKIILLSHFEEMAIEKFGKNCTGFTVEDTDFYDGFNFSSGENVTEALAKFHMFIAAMISGVNY